MKQLQIRRHVQRLGNWIKTHKVATAIITVCIIGMFAGLLLAITEKSPAPSPPKPTPVRKSSPAQKFYSPLTGLEIPDETAAKQAATAIMIENSPDARPQSGLKQAGVVYEAIAEGGITRFLALYQQSKPQVIGPVRSLRLYFVDWLSPYQPSVAHVGGSREALNLVRSGSYRDIDQFFNGSSYWRANDRRAPHNVYTSFDKLDALNTAKGYTKSEFTSFARADGKPAEQPTASSLQINVSGATYNSHYTYDSNSNSYFREQGGAPHLDREDGQIQPRVVIALKVNMYHALEDGYRENIETIGGGQAVIFQNGVAIEANWTKPDRNSTISFSDATGKEIPLARGQTWITAVPNQSGGVSWQ